MKTEVPRMPHALIDCVISVPGTDTSFPFHGTWTEARIAAAALARQIERASLVRVTATGQECHVEPDGWAGPLQDMAR